MSTSSPASSSSSTEREPLLQRTHIVKRAGCSLSRLRLRSKTSVLIILWTVFIGMGSAVFDILTTAIIINNHVYSRLDDLVTYPAAMLYAGLAIVALLYPLIGFLSDLGCGRFKVVIVSFGLFVLSVLTIYSFVLLYFVFLIGDYHRVILEYTPVTYVLGGLAGLTLFVGFAGYQANFIQLGLNQHISAPSEELALFVHWAMWAYNLGCCITVVVYRPYECFDVGITAKIVIFSIPLIIIVFFVLVLVVSCLKRRWFNSELRQQNPFKIIVKVLLFARRNKYPLHRSAFTYSSDKKYTRLDFAKEIFGGPFTTEQVEDTKSFFKILAVLFSLGPVFAVNVPSSYLGLTIFGYHVGSVHNVNNSMGFLDSCTSWVLVWSGNLKYISGAVLFPIYMWFIFSYLRKRVPKMFVRLAAGIVTYLLGNLCLLVIDLIGHALYNKHDTNASEEVSLCMFHYNGISSRHLGMHWSVMVLPSVLLSIGPLVIMTTSLEFISAQSPHFMKGFIIGLLFAIVGLFQFVGAVAFVPFSVENLWATAAMIKEPPIANCGFGYLLFTSVVAFTGLIAFVIVAKRYTYRVRDDDPYNQSQVEEIVDRYLERPVDSYSY